MFEPVSHRTHQSKVLATFDPEAERMRFIELQRAWQFIGVAKSHRILEQKMVPGR